MKATVPNESASPTLGCNSGGITKREHFAGMALQGLVSSYKMNTALGVENLRIIAEMSVALADALIEQLNKRGEPNVKS